MYVSHKLRVEAREKDPVFAFKMDLAAQLMAKRKREGLSFEQLSGRSGISSDWLEAMERGDTTHIDMGVMVKSITALEYEPISKKFGEEPIGKDNE